MTIKRLVSPERYIGLSTDTKPAGVRPGATFYAYDTDLMYITYDDGTNWVTKASLDTIGVLSAGTALIGKVGIDQATANANEVVIKTDTGAYTTPAHTAVTVGATSTTALAANANRLYALFQNDSVETIYIALGTAAALNTAVRLLPNGEGVYEMSKKLGNLYVGAVNAICTSGSKVLLVTEGV